MEFGKKFWLNGKLLDIDTDKISILTHSLHYGMGVFEGIRCFKTNNGLISFRLKDHISRLFKSAAAYSMPLKYTEDEMLDACKLVVKSNGSQEFYIRPLIYYGAGEMGLNPLKNPLHVAIIVWMWPAYFDKEVAGKGLSCTVSPWRKIPNESLPQYAKGTANYANSGLAKLDAVKKGNDEAILLNKEGMVAECTGENLFIVKNGKIKTPPISAGILEGITRDSIITLANELKISVTEENVTKEELLDADEVFLTGTATGVNQVSKIDSKNFNVDENSISNKLREFYFSIASGKKGGFDKWLDKI